ncbi:MAG: vanadium-dependent haloperoxidase [Planctomycetota bacterium]
MRYRAINVRSQLRLASNPSANHGFARRPIQWTLATCLIALALVSPGCNVFGFLPVDDTSVKTAFLRWNQIATDASGLDHTPPKAGETRNFKEQVGPCRASRAMAIVHIAMFDSVVAIAGGFDSYTGIDPAPVGASIAAAIAQAAHDTLASLFPAQTSIFDNNLTDDLAAIPDSTSKTDGINTGKAAAAAILAQRTNDGSEIDDPYTFNTDPGYWRVDPINPTQTPLNPNWFRVKPFAINSATQFRAPAPPAMTSAEYTTAYNEAKSVGGDGITTPTTRTEEQTQIGNFWAYDGTPSLCAPPRLYNQITRQIASDQGTNGMEQARLLTLVNIAMADAGIAVWESKYYYNLWRPVSGIREGDLDGNADTAIDATYVPLCAPASNLAGANFTPPFPAYPSGHAGFGGALFETLRNFYGSDDIGFTFTSDEYNGVTVDNLGNVRPLLPRSFTTLSQAEEENGQSRIYLGIHWSFDKTEGIAIGNNVADHVFSNVYQAN